MGDLSAHFSRIEFRCKCGCGTDVVDAKLLELCEVAREIEGGPLAVNSGNRCKEHNAKVGGAENSQHVKFKAADLKSKDPERLFDELCRLYPNQYGFGLYSNRALERAA